jgi:hypothetical protein
MNYSYQLVRLGTLRSLDYSFGRSSPLNKSALVESAGIGEPPFRFFGVIFGPSPTVVGSAFGPINWNRNKDAMGRDIFDPGVLPGFIDISRDDNQGLKGCPANSGTTLNDFNDWANLIYDIGKTTPGNAAEGARSQVVREASLDTRDSDGDGMPDVLDNCPGSPNANQADSNGDRIGDACEVTPILECVQKTGPGAFLAYFGYKNPAGGVLLPIGPANHFSPGPADLGQGFDFFPGRQHGVIAVPFTGSALTWTFGTCSVTASSSSPVRRPRLPLPPGPPLADRLGAAQHLRAVGADRHVSPRRAAAGRGAPTRATIHG